MLSLRLAGAFVAPAGLAVLACLLAAATGPTAAWRHSGIGTGGAELRERTQNALREWMNQRRRNVLWEAEGIETSVAITQGDGLAFIVNGKTDGSALGDAPTQVMLSLIGAILHPRPTNVFVVGLGTGETAGWLAEVDSITRVDVAELEPAIAEVARRCAPINFNVLEHRKVHVIYNDGREVLLTSPDKYDLIVSEPSNPYRAGIASLFTREFYEAAERRLNDDGLFLQWVQSYDVDGQTLRSVFATVGSVFGHVEIWQSQPGDLVLVCSRRPIEYVAPTLRRKILEEPLKSALAKTWHASDLEGFLARYVAGPAIVAEVSRRDAALINTDDRNRVEYAFARTVGRRTGISIVRLGEQAIALSVGRPPVRGGTVDWSLVDDQRIALAIIVEDAELDAFRLDPGGRARAQALKSYLRGDMRGTIAAWDSQPREPATHIELAIMAHAHADLADEKALPLIERLQAKGPVEADALRSLLFWRQEKIDEADQAVQAAFRGMRTNPWPLRPIARTAFDTAVAIAQKEPARALSLYRAIEKPLAMHSFEEPRGVAAYIIAERLDPAINRRLLESFEPHIPWRQGFLTRRAETYRANGHPLAGQAEADLRWFLEHAHDDSVVGPPTQ